MIEPRLYARARSYFYDVHGQVSYKYDDTPVLVESIDVEEDPHLDHVFTVDITTTCNKILRYESDDIGNWPLAVKRLFDQHVRVRASANV